MDKLKSILVFLIAVIYLFLSTGVALLETHCLCSDSKSISLNSNSDPCYESISDHSCCGEENQHTDGVPPEKSHDCGCEEPVVTYLKLTSHLVDGNHGQYPNGKNLNLVSGVETALLKMVDTSSETVAYPDYLPPDNTLYGRYLITFLNQRKIALLA
ncbi:MAG TPA: hypothetical protein VFG54_18700 [Prolixibacteraceae bacterium]|nr:hypothetical protein [Prolixibacteraceae bacterium]